ncbi:ATP-binding protein [Serratia quinivorans]|uniref:ATP-binding protein n=1 Tax=Serratia quinivorans TaxID=137545 RepID=UPI00107E9171|nr:ATP-binding protein [Serratia quinivorans]QBX69375.1 AAA family ATPase [Serratia quinivorans]
MLNFEKIKQQQELKHRSGELVDELDFALGNGMAPHYASWEKQTQVVACETHGDYQQIILVGPEYRGRPGRKVSRCPECLRAEQNDIELALRQLNVESLLDDAGIAPRFQHCEFSNYQPVNAPAAKNLANCQRYAQNWEAILAAGTGLVMTGSCGTGKNHLAVSMTKQIIRDHLADVEITDVMRLTREVKSTWRNGAERTETEVLNHYATLDLLIIDEVGVQFGTPAELAILQEIVNARYENILPTILISNLTFDQLKAFVGDRIVDRVTDGGSNRLVFDWPSYRSNKGGVTA